MIETDQAASGSRFFTAGNDGVVKIWDARKYECLDQVTAHKAKYEEGALAVCGIASLNMIATGGADSAINLYEISDKF